MAKLTSHPLSLGKTLHSMTLKLDELLHKLANPESNTRSPSSSAANPHIVSPSHSHRMNLKVPRFDGSDPLG